MKQKNNHPKQRYIKADSGNRILLMLLIFAVAVNLGPFESIKYSNNAPGYRTIFMLADFGVVSAEGISHRRGLYLALRQTAPNANVLLPENSPLDIAQIYGLGRAKHVSYINYNPYTLGSDVDFSDYIVAGFRGNKNMGPGPFVVAIKNENPETIILLNRNDTFLLVDIDLLDMEFIREKHS